LIEQLASQVGVRSGEPNRAAAERCMDNPALLQELADAIALRSGSFAKADAALLGDCAEVMTMVGQRRPDLVAPYVSVLTPLFAHGTARVRWEAAHAVACAAALAPEPVLAKLPKLAQMIRSDQSIIVRDYSVDALGNLAKTGAAAAAAVYPILKEALRLWDGRHAARAIAGLGAAAVRVPAYADEVRAIAGSLAEHEKPVVRKTAKTVLKMLK